MTDINDLSVIFRSWSNNNMRSRKVRVFLSSTFRDMNAERDHLVRVVFPRVKDYCESRFLEFIPIDLRWGIPEEDSRNGRVLNACLQEVDNSRPFFIGILGSRYGWKPSPAELDVLEPSLHKEKPWLKNKISDGSSITEMEIDYAVLRDMKVPHACFFIRSDNMKVPEDFCEPTGSESSRKLDALKERIRNQKKYPVMEYDSPEQMGKMLFQELIAMIDAEYPSSENDESLQVLTPHEQTLETKSETLCDISSIYSDYERWINGGKRMYLISGQTGYGTSTALCYTVSRCRKMKYSDVNYIYFDFQSLPADIELIDGFSKFLDNISFSDNLLNIIAIDNATILNAEEIELLSSIIDRLDENIRIMMAVAINSQAYDYFKFKYEPAYSTIHGFIEAQRREYVKNYASRFGKQLTDGQITKIIEGKNSSDPTFLRLLMEAVVSYGVYETLDKHIDKLIDIPDADFMFYSIMEDYDVDYSKVGLFWPYFYGVTAVSLSPKGISEQDIMDAFGISQAEWSAVRPGVMRFCKGTTDRLMLVRQTWNHQVKMYWSTHIRAQAGKILSDWFLSSPERRATRGENIASIYNDIWHLPFAYKDDEKASQLSKEYTASVTDYFFSPESVLSISQSTLALFTAAVTRKGSTIEEIETRMRNNLFVDKYKDYYRKLAKTFEAGGRKDLMLTALNLLIEAMVWRGDSDVALVRAEIAMHSGKPQEAEQLLEKATVIKHRKVEVISLLIKTWCIGGDWEKLYMVHQKIEADKLFEDDEVSDENYMQFLEALTEMYLTFVIFGNDTTRKNILEEVNEAEQSFRSSGLFSTVVYNYFMIRAILAFLSGDDVTLRYYAYYAYKAAAEVFSSRQDCWQFGRAANLFAIAVYNQSKEYVNWRNSPYVQRRYDPLDYWQKFPEGAEPKAHSTADDMNRFYEWTISTIQPK